VPIVDVYTAFGGDAGMASHVCGSQPWTWICDPTVSPPDPHPTTAGYQQIAKAVEVSLGLPGTNPLPGVPLPGFPQIAPGSSTLIRPSSYPADVPRAALWT
jgi:hypothetical protein